jgi:hypothetical protein
MLREKYASCEVKVEILELEWFESAKFDWLRDFIGIIFSADQKPRFKAGIILDQIRLDNIPQLQRNNKQHKAVF